MFEHGENIYSVTSRLDKLVSKNNLRDLRICSEDLLFKDYMEQLEIADKKIWIVANWKSNQTMLQASSWLETVGPKLPKNSNLKIVVCPLSLEIEEIKKAVMVGGYPLEVGSQDLSPFDIGAHTGEEAAKILSEFVALSILGHSERRRELGETDELVAQKVKQAESAGILPLLCVQDQNTPIPMGVKLIAYEPIFAIGTGTPDTPENAQQVALAIKQKTSSNVEILYGGSVNSSNVGSFLELPDINGVLIGGASLDPNEFIKIVETASKI